MRTLLEVTGQRNKPLHPAALAWFDGLFALLLDASLSAGPEDKERMHRENELHVKMSEFLTGDCMGENNLRDEGELRRRFDLAFISNLLCPRNAALCLVVKREAKIFFGLSPHLLLSKKRGYLFIFYCSGATRSTIVPTVMDMIGTMTEVRTLLSRTIVTSLVRMMKGVQIGKRQTTLQAQKSTLKNPQQHFPV